MVLVLCAAASVAHAAPVVPELPTIDAAVVPPGRGRATEPSVGAIGDVVAIAFSDVDGNRSDVFQFSTLDPGARPRLTRSDEGHSSSRGGLAFIDRRETYSLLTTPSLIGGEFNWDNFLPVVAPDNWVAWYKQVVPYPTPPTFWESQHAGVWDPHRPSGPYFEYRDPADRPFTSVAATNDRPTSLVLPPTRYIYGITKEYDHHELIRFTVKFDTVGGQLVEEESIQRYFLPVEYELVVDASAGGRLVCYSVLNRSDGLGTIECRSVDLTDPFPLLTPNLQHEAWICKEYRKPRLSEYGRYVAYEGLGCEFAGGYSTSVLFLTDMVAKRVYVVERQFKDPEDVGSFRYDVHQNRSPYSDHIGTVVYTLHGKVHWKTFSVAN